MNTMVGKALMLTVAAAGLFSCAAGTTPRWEYDRAGKPVQYKRYPRHFAVDYFSRFRRVAYVKLTKPLDELVSADQRAWLKKYGQPDYYRRPFGSRAREKVQEWIYLKRNKMVQFVGGHVVYDGEVTDLEKTMLTYGYPRSVLVRQAEPGVERLTFVYSRPFGLEYEVFDFANGQVVFRQTMR